MKVTMYRLAATAWAGDMATFDRLLESQRELVERIGEPFTRWTLAMTSSSRAQIAGDADLAEERAERARLVGTAGGQPDAVLMHATQLLASAGCEERWAMPYRSWRRSPPRLRVFLR